MDIYFWNFWLISSCDSGFTALIILKWIMGYAGRINIKTGHFKIIFDIIFTTQRTQVSLGGLQDIWKRSWRLTNKPDVFTMSGRRSRICEVLKTSDLRRLEDVRFITSWRRLFYDVWFTTSRRCWIYIALKIIFTTSLRRMVYDVLRTYDLRRLEDAGFTSSQGQPIFDVWKTSNLRRLEDVWITTSWRPM